MNNRIGNILKIAESYSEKGVDSSDIKKPKKSLFAWILKWIARFYIRSIFIALLLGGSIWAVIIIFFMLSGGNGGIGGDENDFTTGESFNGFFSQDFLDIPFGIPVERGIISMAIDKTKYGPKDPYGLRSYAGHMGQDISRTFGDKSQDYSPYVVATHRGMIVLAEVRKIDTTNPLNYIYTRYTYNNGSYLITTSTISKTKADMVDPTFKINTVPYGQRIVLSTMDGKYYTLFGHLSSIRSELFNNGPRIINRGDIIGRMGSTGNSTGPHVHFEVLSCGEQKENQRKPMNYCTRLNPFGWIDQIQNNFIGIDPRKVQIVSAGVAGALKEPTTEESLIGSVQKTKKNFCDTSKAIFITTAITCNEVFPIVYQSSKRNAFTQIDDSRGVFLYILNKYGVKEKDLTSKKWEEIRKSENLNSMTQKDMITELGRQLTYGPYLNKTRIYKIPKDLGDKQKLLDTSLANMVEDINTLYKSNGRNIEKTYKAFTDPNNTYKGTNNPYVYNFIDINHLVLSLSNGKPFMDYGLFTIYSKI